MKHLFVINPIAGKGKAIDYVDTIEDIFKNRTDEYEVVLTERIGHATEVVKEKTKEKQHIVYSIGGDGTLNEVLNGIMGSNSILAVIPSGSGNDFARTLLKNNFNNEILEKTIDGKQITIDVGTVNGRYFLNISSVGFDAVVGDNARWFKKKPGVSGSMAYFLSLIKTAVTFKAEEMKFYFEDKELNGEMYLIAVANGNCYGGGLKIAPFANVRDGSFDIYAIKKVKLRRLVRFIPRLFTGKDLSDIDEVEFIRSKNIKIECDNEVIVNVDGELLYDKKLNFEIIPNGVNLLVPKEIEI